MQNITFKGISQSASLQITKEYPKEPAKKHFLVKCITNDAFIPETENQIKQKKIIDIDYSADKDYFIVTRPKGATKAEDKIIAQGFKNVDEAINFLKEITIQSCEKIKQKAEEKLSEIGFPHSRPPRSRVARLNCTISDMNAQIKDINRSIRNWEDGKK